MTGQIAISSSSHPLAAGLSGTVTVLSSSDVMYWGVPNGNAAKVATLTGDSNKATLFAYESGSSMPGLTAPAKRVGFFLGDNSGTKLTNDGWQLFETAVSWATE